MADENLVDIRVNPITVADRLRKIGHEMTEENRHSEAFLIAIAVEIISKQQRIINQRS